MAAQERRLSWPENGLNIYYRLSFSRMSAGAWAIYEEYVTARYRQREARDTRRTPARTAEWEHAGHGHEE